VFDGEEQVDAAVALPEVELRVADLLIGQSAVVGVGVVEDHRIERMAEGVGGVAAQVLVGHEEDLIALGQGPFEHLSCVGTGAAGAVVLAAKGLDGGGAVDVSDRDDLGVGE